MSPFTNIDGTRPSRTPAPPEPATQRQLTSVFQSEAPCPLGKLQESRGSRGERETQGQKQQHELQEQEQQEQEQQSVCARERRLW
jgi:hypothetical protein